MYHYHTDFGAVRGGDGGGDVTLNGSHEYYYYA